MNLGKQIKTLIYRHPQSFLVIGLVVSLTLIYNSLLRGIVTPPSEVEILEFNQRRQLLRKRRDTSNDE